MSIKRLSIAFMILIFIIPMVSIATKVPKGNISPSLVVENSQFRIYWFNNERHKNYTAVFNTKGQVIERETEVGSYVSTKDWEEFDIVKLVDLTSYLDSDCYVNIKPFHNKLIVGGIGLNELNTLVLLFYNEKTKTVEKIQRIKGVQTTFRSYKGIPDASNIVVNGHSALVASLFQRYDDAYHLDLYLIRWDIYSNSMTKYLVREDVDFSQISLAAINNNLAIAYVHGGCASGASEITIDLIKSDRLKTYKEITTQDIR